MQEQCALNEVQGTQDQEIILSITALGHEAIQSPDQAHGDVPFESLLQLEELAEGRVAGQIGEVLSGRRRLNVIPTQVLSAMGAIVS
jgi:hypothetical protein